MSQPYRRGSRDRRGGRNANPVAGGGPRNSGDRRNNGSPAERKGSGGSFSGRPPPGNFEGQGQTQGQGGPLSLKERMTRLICLLVGQTVIVSLSDGSVYQGILHSGVSVQGKRYGGEEGMAFGLKMAKKESDDESDILKRPLESLVLWPSMIRHLQVKDVRWKAQPTEGGVRDLRGGFLTDSAISGVKGTKDRELVAWAPTEATSATSATWLSGGIEGGDSSGPWDQFSANKELFGVETSFQEEIYTTPLDKQSDQYRQKEAEAERIAKEIYSQSSQNVHLQEERGQKIQNDMDEEDLYSGVIRQDENQETAKTGETAKEEKNDESQKEEGTKGVEESASSSPNKDSETSGSGSTPSSSKTESEEKEGDEKEKPKSLSLSMKAMRADADDFNPFELDVLESLPTTHVPSQFPGGGFHPADPGAGYGESGGGPYPFVVPDYPPGGPAGGLPRGGPPGGHQMSRGGVPPHQMYGGPMMVPPQPYGQPGSPSHPTPYPPPNVRGGMNPAGGGVNPAMMYSGSGTPPQSPSGYPPPVYGYHYSPQSDRGGH